MGYIFVDRSSEGGQMRSQMRNEMRRGYRRGYNSTSMRDEMYREGYRHGWEDKEAEMDEDYRRGRDNLGRYV